MRTTGSRVARHLEQAELPATLDRQLALDLIPTPIYWRMIVIDATPSRDEVTSMATPITTGLHAMG